MRTAARAVLATVSAFTLGVTGYVSLHRGPSVSSVPVGHDPSHTASCEAGVFAGGSHMPAGSVATAILDGTSVSFTFTDQTSKVEGASIANPDTSKPHTYELKLISSDGVGSFDITGELEPCNASTTAVISSTTGPTSAPSVASSAALPTTTTTTTSPSATTTRAPSTTTTFDGSCGAIQAPDTRVCVPTSPAPAPPTTKATCVGVIVNGKCTLVATR